MVVDANSAGQDTKVLVDTAVLDNNLTLRLERKRYVTIVRDAGMTVE